MRVLWFYLENGRPEITPAIAEWPEITPALKMAEWPKITPALKMAEWPEITPAFENGRPEITPAFENGRPEITPTIAEQATNNIPPNQSVKIESYFF